MVTLYLNFCSVFGESAIYPWDDFMKLPYNIIEEIIVQRSKRNEEAMKKQEEMLKAKTTASKKKR